MPEGRVRREGAFLVGLGLRARESCESVLRGQGFRVLVYDHVEDAADDLSWMSPSFVMIPARDEQRWTELLLERSDAGLGPVDVLPDLVSFRSVQEYLWRGAGCEPMADLLGDAGSGDGAGFGATHLLEPVMAHELEPVVRSLMESRRLRRRRLARQRVEPAYIEPLGLMGARSRFAVLVRAGRLVEELTGVGQVAFVRHDAPKPMVEQVFGVARRRLPKVVRFLESLDWEDIEQARWVPVKGDRSRPSGVGIGQVYRVDVSLEGDGRERLSMVLLERKPLRWHKGADSDVGLVAEHVRLGLQSAGEPEAEERHRDPWTGLPGPSHFGKMVEHLFADGIRRVRILCVDLMGFSDINEKFGHLAGAYLLTQVASRLVRAGADIVGRSGPDSFLLAVAGRALEPPGRLESFVCSPLMFDLRRVPRFEEGVGGQEPEGGWLVPVRFDIRSTVVESDGDVQSAVRELTTVA